MHLDSPESISSGTGALILLPPFSYWGSWGATLERLTTRVVVVRNGSSLARILCLLGRKQQWQQGKMGEEGRDGSSRVALQLPSPSSSRAMGTGMSLGVFLPEGERPPPRPAFVQSAGAEAAASCKGASPSPAELRVSSPSRSLEVDPCCGVVPGRVFFQVHPRKFRNIHKFWRRVVLTVMSP